MLKKNGKARRREEEKEKNSQGENYCFFFSILQRRIIDSFFFFFPLLIPCRSFTSPDPSPCLIPPHRGVEEIRDHVSCALMR